MKNLKIEDGTSLYFGIKKTLVNYKYQFSRSNPEITSFEKNRFLLSKIQVVKQKNFQIFWKINIFQNFSKLTIGFHLTLVLMFFYTAQTFRINRAKVTIGFCFTLKRERPKWLYCIPHCEKTQFFDKFPKTHKIFLNQLLLFEYEVSWKNIHNYKSYSTLKFWQFWHIWNHT